MRYFRTLNFYLLMLLLPDFSFAQELNETLKTITTMYAPQMCKTFPISDCFSVTEDQCQVDLTKAVEDCISEKKDSMPNTVNSIEEAKKIGNMISDCSLSKYIVFHKKEQKLDKCGDMSALVEGK